MTLFGLGRRYRDTGNRYNARMFRLTREVRFAVNSVPDEQLADKPANSYAGYPSLTGLGHYFCLDVTVAGALDPASSYLLNIKAIDQRVRESAVPLVTRAVRETRFGGGGRVALELFDVLRGGWNG